jgi:hypothetical protein
MRQKYFGSGNQAQISPASRHSSSLCHPQLFMQMTPIQQSELAVLRLKGRLATRQQDLAIAQKANRDTTEIQTQILVVQHSIDLAEKNLKRLKRERTR